MSNVIKLQKKPLPPILLASSDDDEETRRQLAMVRLEFDHASRKLMAVAELYGQSDWAVRLIENTLTDAKMRKGATP